VWKLASELLVLCFSGPFAPGFAALGRSVAYHAYRRAKVHGLIISKIFLRSMFFFY